MKEREKGETVNTAGLQVATEGDVCGEGGLCEDQACLAVDPEHLLDGVDVRGRPQVQTQVVLVGCSHDLLLERKGANYYYMLYCTFIHTQKYSVSNI